MFNSATCSVLPAIFFALEAVSMMGNIAATLITNVFIRAASAMTFRMNGKRATCRTFRAVVY